MTIDDRYSHYSKVLLTGNEAAAQAAYLAAEAAGDPQDGGCGFYTPGYPITPQTTIIEVLAELLKDRKYTLYRNLESEHSVMAACVGASLLGTRTFTASSSHGLLLMAEMLQWASRASAPIVMADVSRALGPPWNIWSDQTASISCRKMGWWQFFCESPQEVLDTILLAFRLAEDPDILIPIMVCFDGFLVSHTSELVKIPTLEQVKNFLPTLKLPYDLIKQSATFGSSSNSYNHAEIEKDRIRRFNILEEVEHAITYKFEDIFGRNLSALEGFFPQDHSKDETDFRIVTMGALSRPAKQAIEFLRDDFSLSLTRVRRFTPFPQKLIANSLKGSQKIIVFNNDSTETLTELVRQSFCNLSDAPPIVSRMIGISGTRVWSDFLTRVIREAIESGAPDDLLDKRWCIDNEDPLPLRGLPLNSLRSQSQKTLSEDWKRDSDRGNESKELFFSGHRACQGCGAAIAMKQAVNTLGENTLFVIPASCSSVIVGPYPHSPLGIPVIHTAFSTTGAISGAIQDICEMRGKDITIVGWAGDGGTADIGLQALSAAAESGKRIIYICYDNEAYMNTGRQRSSTTPFGAHTETTPRGNRRFKKDLMRIMAAHDIPYAATCSIAFLDDLKEKLKKAKQFREEGLCFLHILCPCPPGWNYDPRYTLELARLAVWSNIWVLYEIRNGKQYNITYKFNPSEYNLENIDLLDKYLKMQERFRYISQEDKELIRQYAEANLKYICQLAE